MYKRLVYLIVGFSVSFSAGLAQNNIALPAVSRQVLTRLATQIKRFPQEKVYLQYDKPYYSCGERIWFRAHLVNAALHIPYHLSRYVYVELISPSNEILIRKKIRPTEDAYYGQMDIPSDLAPGWYSLRAYTSYMQNVGEAYFFRRPVYILNPIDKKGTNPAAKKKTPSAQPVTASTFPYFVSFFPEGGQLLGGTLQVIGIRSLDLQGEALPVSGRIVDQSGKELTSFTTTQDGLGIIALNSMTGNSYFAQCEDNQGRTCTIPLPPVQEKGYALSIQHNASTVMVSLLSTTPPADTLYLVAHQRGIPVSAFVFTADNQTVSFSKQGLPSGILQLLLLDKSEQLLSDRMLFVKGDDLIRVSATTDKPSYRKRDSVVTTLTLRDVAGKPVKASVSLSVTNNSDVVINPDDPTIESYLLLQSELKTPLNNPNRFFRENDKASETQLDLLMMTEKWMRYAIPEIIKGHLAKGDSFVVERGGAISGRVISFPFKRPLPNTSVSLFIPKLRHADVTNTDQNGHFYFEGFEYPDSTKIMLQATKKVGNFMTLVPDQDTLPPVTLALPTPVTPPLPEKNLSQVMEKSRQKYRLENGVMSIDLKEVEVVGEKKDKLAELRLDRGAYYSAPSQSFSGDDLETATSIVDVLIRAAGITLDESGTGVYLRGKRPLVKVDNITWTMDEMATLNISEVELIDILKDPAETAIFGSEGANGVICIYLKRGEAQKASQELGANQALISPLGYCIPETFPSPDYSTLEKKLSSTPDLRSTLYWNPNVLFNEQGEAKITFFLADEEGPVTLVMEGVSPDGSIIYYRTVLNNKGLSGKK